MTSSRRWGWAAALTMATVFAAGCATMNVSSFVQSGQDFSAYQTYGWASGDQLRTGDPRLDNNPFFLERLQGDVDRGLASRGLGKASATPDLLVYYHVSITQEINTNGVEAPYGYECDSCEPYVYDAGTLLLDLVDTRTNKLVWRGWAEDTMGNAIDNQDFMERKIDEAVNQILGTLPREL